jgi:biotin synthase
MEAVMVAAQTLIEPKNNWTLDEVQALYDRPLLSLVFDAQTVHRKFHEPTEIQRCSLLSVKTGACPEDCGYCSQSSRNDTTLERESLMDVEAVLSRARAAKASGASRFCMGAAWRNAKQGPQFEKVLEMVRGVAALDMEACVTLGMLTADQAVQLKDAGLTAYNHNLDTSREHYGNVITTRTYDDRLQTLKYVNDAGLSVCCGGILGLGETVQDRISLLHTLATLSPHPESVPINKLVPVKGTPLENEAEIDVFDLVRCIAAARILMPGARVRLSAGRLSLTPEGQALCFMAGANSIFFGDTLLTTANPAVARDNALLDTLGLVSR